MTTAAVIWQEGREFALEDVELDEPRPDEVRVRLVAAGMCHTDLSVAKGVTPFPLPGVLGHEGVGVVEEVGSRVVRAKPGDRVLMTFTSCGRCRNCRGGHPALCEFHLPLNLFGGRRADGSATIRHKGEDLGGHFFGQSSFAQHAIVDERSLVVLDHVAEADLPVLAPLGCGLQTGAGAILNVLRPTPGSTVVVAGAGAVGLAAVMAAARMSPAPEIVVVDRVESRLELARELGATTVATSADALDGADFAVDTTGNVGVIEQLVAGLAVGGTCALIGAPRAGSRASFDVNRMLPGRSIVGVTLGDGEPETFVPLLAAAHTRGEFPMERFQKTYAFEDINAAAADAESGAVVKPILLF
ncbi:NAD(P)-dependent alcohol dehydrogenase [Amycolatopsis rhabdoformis]|uniref:NAD(P)-dependent alcohol dehydrogenase n=1 Tax=Amycolatopsis rhabdoformis TaxID=1448059 RepID=A0ABZ1HVL5_9PSEU|nr:NAD(P)-dependent alcohol dehydrogenase [Amycolatopsis rhabdoformis]WSE26278.1 NAD(P)-dependent alcohol dehydrogenase [Amycolatopsis rhabdoformis]